jgi:hypothetical protein
MDAALALGGRHPLDAVPAGLDLDALYALALDLDGEELVPGARVRAFRRADPSTVRGGELDVAGGELGDEDARILTTLAGADLYGSL